MLNATGFEQQVEGGGEERRGGTAELTIKDASPEPAIVGLVGSETLFDFGNEGFGRGAERVFLVDKRERAVQLEPEVLDEGNGAIDGVTRDRNTRIVRMPEGMDDKDEAGEVNRIFAIEAPNDERCRTGEINLGIEPGDPQVMGGTREGDDRAGLEVT
jgi:hypothetical protein